MPIGVLTNCAAVLLGGLLGTYLGKILPRGLKDNLPTLFGFCSIAIGVNSIIKASGMTAVVFHNLVRVLHLGGEDIDMEFYITAVALFCCSGFGWYSTLTEGITGDPSLLMSKAVLDGFTAMIFAASLGKSICAIPLPQCAILLVVYMVGRTLSAYLTPTMFADLSACGGILTMAAGFRVSKIKSVPLVDLMPALILVMPFSMAWSCLLYTSPSPRD